MPMNRANFPKGLEEGINAWFGMEYSQHPEEWRGCFEQDKSNKAYEEETQMVGFGAGQLKAEGGTIAYDAGSEGWSARYMHNTYALAFAITQEAIEDNLYHRLAQKYGRALARAMLHAKEIQVTHPVSKAKIKITADMPDDMAAFLETHGAH